MAKRNTADAAPFGLPDARWSALRAAARRLVPAASSRSPLARQIRAVPRLGQRDHAAADPGRHRHSVFRAFRRRLSRRASSRRRRRARRAPPLGRAGLLSPRPSDAPRSASDRGRPRRPIPARPASDRKLAGHRALYGGRHRVDRIRQAGADSRSQHRAALQPAGRLPRRNDHHRRPAHYLWQVAESILPASDCRTFNQALMELGSLVCTPREPALRRMPRQSALRGASGTSRTKFRAKPKPRIESVREAAVVVRRGGRILLRQREAGERWAGLWDFVRFELTSRGRAALVAELQEQVRAQSGLSVGPPRCIATLKHSVTRFRITLDCFSAETIEPAARPKRGTWKWVRSADLDRYPLSVTGRKLSRLLTAEVTNGSSTDHRRVRAATKRGAGAGSSALIDNPPKARSSTR